MTPVEKEELAQYIQKEVNQYKKPQNKNDEFVNQLMQKAEAKPSRLWAVYAPTKKLAHNFFVVENKLKAKEYFDNYINKTTVDSLRTIAAVCYSRCRIIDAKSSDKLDEQVLEQWRNAFKPILSEFNAELDKVIKETNEFVNKTPEEQNQQLLDALNSTQSRNKPKF
jgi:hypothetical protein